MNRPKIDLPYGSRPYELAPERPARVVNLPPGQPGLVLKDLLEDALDGPVGSSRLESLAGPGDRVVVVVSDSTRNDPRSELIAAIRARLPSGVHLSLAIANGTHTPRAPDALGIDPALLVDMKIVNHDCRDTDAIVDLGRTARGTPVLVNRAAAEADLIIATGRIKPHYFAGFGAGCKAIFPGLAEHDAIRRNHRLKILAGSVAGRVDGNPCRDDLLEAASLVGGKRFLLNAVFDADEHPRAACAGNLDDAFRAGAQACRKLFSVRAPRSRLVIASDALPLTASLYQASKLAAAVACLLAPGGTLVLVAECGDGTGPVDIVNQAIYEIGIKPRLPSEHTIFLVSSLTPEQVAPTYCTWAPSVDAIIADHYAKLNVRRGSLDQANPGIPSYAPAAEMVIVPQAGSALIELQLDNEIETAP